MSTRTINVTVVEHHPEGEDCRGDYGAVSVWVDGVEVVRYGDHYHDKGADKASGFVDGLLYRIPDDHELIVTCEERADYETFWNTPAPE